jgi:hypothetical protein
LLRIYNVHILICLVHGSAGGKKLYTECCSRKQRSGIAWLIAGIWQLKGVRRNADKGRCPLCFEREDVKHILLECKETKYWREKLIHDK